MPHAMSACDGPSTSIDMAGSFVANDPARCAPMLHRPCVRADYTVRAIGNVVSQKPRAKSQKLKAKVKPYEMLFRL